MKSISFLIFALVFAAGSTQAQQLTSSDSTTTKSNPTTTAAQPTPADLARENARQANARYLRDLGRHTPRPVRLPPAQPLKPLKDNELLGPEETANRARSRDQQLQQMILEARDYRKNRRKAGKSHPVVSSTEQSETKNRQPAGN